LCTELGPAQCYSHRPRVGFRPHNACPNHSRRRRHCFLTAAHRSWVPTAPQFSVPTCAALALAYNLCELNADGFPFTFSSSCISSLLRGSTQSKPKPPAFFCHGRLNIDRTSSATPDPAATPLSSAHVPHSSTSHQPAHSTSDSSPSSSFPITDPRRRGQSVLVRLHPSTAPNRKPHWPGLGPRPIPHRSSATGWSDFAGDHRCRGMGKALWA
jgi:hypothetical protein